VYFDAIIYSFFYSHLYIIVAVNNSVIENVVEIPTQVFLEKPINTTPLFYVAAVVYSSQYVPGYRMSYILGAGDNTTDPYGHIFYNREVQQNYYFFYRVFSANSTQEVQYLHRMYVTTSLYLSLLE